jgi:hypothetical protein
MPARIDEAIRRGVVWLWISGERMEEIAAKKNISLGSVRNIIAELKQGQYPEYQEYLPYLNDFRWLSQRLKATGHSLQEAIAGSVLLGFLARLGTEPAELEELLELLRKISPQGFPRERFVQAALRVNELEEETGLDFKEIEKKAEGMGSDIATKETRQQELTNSISSLQVAEQEARKNHDRTVTERKQELHHLEQKIASQLASNRLTEEQLAKHCQVQAALASHGISFENLDTLLKVLNEFEKHGMEPRIIVEFVKKINGLSEQVDAWNTRVSMVQKELADGKKSLETINDQVSKGKAELDALRGLKAELETQLDQTKKDYDRYYLPIDFAQTILHLLNEPWRATDQQLLNLSDSLQSIVKTRKSATKDLLINYDKPRDLLRLLLETVGGKTLVFKETQDREMTALRNQNSELELNIQRKLRGQKEELRRDRINLDLEKRALGDAAEDKLIEVAVAQVKKGVIFLGKCKSCHAKGAVIPGNRRPIVHFRCPCCIYSLEPISNSALKWVPSESKRVAQSSTHDDVATCYASPQMGHSNYSILLQMDLERKTG